jgi:hypothetical protein
VPSITQLEREKYQAAWAMDAYAENSPGENFVDLFMEMTGAQPGQTVLDIGCGAGAGSKALSERFLEVTGFDLVGGDIQGSVWRDLPQRPSKFAWGYCCDMMEHIPTQFVGLSVSEMLKVCDRVFFSISFNRDVHGDSIRDRLHLTIESFVWWRDTLSELGHLIEARDLVGGNGVFLLGR